jgi:hypothetical protein
MPTIDDTTDPDMNALIRARARTRWDPFAQPDAQPDTEHDTDTTDPKDAA